MNKQPFHELLEAQTVATLAEKLENIPTGMVLLVKCPEGDFFTKDMPAYWVPSRWAETEWEYGYVFFQSSLVISRWLATCKRWDCVQWVIDTVNIWQR